MADTPALRPAPQAERAEVSFSWAEVERQCGLVRDRATPRPAPAGEVG